MARVVLLDENTGLYYTVLEDSLKRRPGKAKKKMKFAVNRRSVEEIGRVEECFGQYASPQNIAAAFGSMLAAVAKGECNSVSISVYREEMQVTFWQKRGKGSEVLASFQFSSPDGFIAGIEELN